MPRTLINISWCASHYKGANPGDAGPPMRGVDHASWLEDAVKLYAGHDVIVSCTAWPGMLDVETCPGNEERDVLWRIVASRVPIMGIAGNPGHQVGAALTIRMGLEYAARCGYAYMIHTAEDVMPLPSSLPCMLDYLEKFADYTGQKWGLDGSELNTQFFGCRVQSLVSQWDSCQVSSHGCIEKYMAHLLRDANKMFINPLYRTTHNRADWLRWKEERNQ